ncbi:PadR family transcriptional regulator [Phenylobacterium sp.]|uniref:PadR family transcriptional regulator n=1 Tax=Phenylobacterium sp. TaxID=1871053 RepID=UPI001229C42A|nr:PadR family transcriptional regulator [Phenylobacterium sp.]THD58257.1 MAG: PadR family transcriptional regulator [Phenylobacterium sp.]
MNQTRRLSELEGAILSEVEHCGQTTAFQVRRAFADSFSLEWKGSAGAVYPAVRRLAQDGLLDASAAQGGRATRRLSITDAGRQALTAWACDAARATSSGVDPFRLRAGIWSLLPASERQALFRELDARIAGNIEEMEAHLGRMNTVERPRVALAIALQQSRRDLLADWADRDAVAPRLSETPAR